MVKASFVCLALLSMGCQSSQPEEALAQVSDASRTTFDALPADAQPADGPAKIVSVMVSGDPDSYEFRVGVLSPDVGCEQYANWWEVISEEGELIHRRILSHSHVPPRFPQPFMRSGRPVSISASTRVFVRAHMNTVGYGSQAFVGSVDSGFTSTTLEASFAATVENIAPQPGPCPF